MIIRAADLDPEGLEVDDHVELGSLRTDADEVLRAERVLLRGRIVPIAGGLRVRGRMSAHLEISCARCMAPYGLDVERDLDLQYAFSSPGGKEFQIPEEDLEVAFLEADGTLDLTQLAEEQVWLEIPMKPLCRPDCRGLCPECRGDLNRGECRCGGKVPPS